MNGQDPFEARLRQQQWRGLPPEWRQDILSAASTAAASRHRPLEAALPPATLWAILQRWMWPHPRAWAGLAAAWALILSLHWVGSDSPIPATISTAPLPVSPQARQILIEQQRLLADLCGPEDSDAPSGPLPPPASPGRTRNVQTNA